MSKLIKKFYIKTFGCQMNTSDSESIAAYYFGKGWEETKNINDADEIIINSCSVRESAENRVFGLVNNLSKLKIVKSQRNTAIGGTNCKPKIILTGCMLRLPENILRKKLPAVDEFKKITEFKCNSQFDNLKICNLQKPAFVKIMNGCNNFCSYCVVPYARGREVSRPIEEIICEVKELTKRGCEEVMLLGQNVNSYGKNLENFQFSISPLKRASNFQLKKIKTPFAVLLQVLNEISGIKKISFLTSNPWDLNDEIIEAMALPKIDRYLHLPLQSGDDEILKKMNRKYTSKGYINLIEKIKKRIPDITFGTDIIVGFPGETEEQFNNTVSLCNKVGFVKAYVNIYSPREQTAAYKIKEEIPFSEKRRRWKVLDEMINQGSEIPPSSRQKRDYGRANRK